MKFIVSGKKPKGIYYNGNLYGGDNSPVEILHINTLSFYYKVHTSAGSDYTTGYPVTFSFITTQFELYSSTTLEKFTYIPSHRFVIYNVNVTQINALTLVYDGDGLFHIEGDLSSIKLYSSTKTLPPIVLALVDEKDNVLLSNVSGILTSKAGSTSETVSFTSATTTYESNKVQREYKEEIQLPYDLSSFSGTLSTTYYPVYSYTMGSATSTYTHKIL